MQIKLIIAAVVATLFLSVGGLAYWQYKTLQKQAVELALVASELEEQKAVQVELLATAAEYQAAIYELQSRQQIVRNTYVTRVEQIQSNDPEVTLDSLGQEIANATR